MFLFENVKYLLRHNKVSTFKQIYSFLKQQTHQLENKILNAFDYAMPKNEND
ncbi:HYPOTHETICAL PROTEIN MCJ_001280 [Mesomycoplasma conjunctivae]|uniref:Uncharacterized protein n=1 Tax=Mesomycoplasma conjunctivae (strain ATCC 25834 / NCTC 10147 / HRC/581) TaxID=572263 RepID=C5J5S9_MESCH|nr:HYPOTHETICAL PROTEIN MCJ_001280 [Mesomycoplasma conjunctivae]